MEKELFDYCKSVIEDFEHLEKIALRKIDRMRCPLSSACPELYDAMSDAIDEYCEDHEIENDFDPEEIFFAG